MVIPLIANPNVRRLLSSDLLVVSAIFILALALRVILLDAYGLWGDEVESLLVARAGTDFIFDSRAGWVANQTVPYYLLIWSVLQPVDPASNAILVRLPSALTGALLILPLFGLGRHLFNRATGITAALMAALSPLLIDYSLDLRPYSLVAFLTVTAVYCLLKAELTGAPLWWAGFVVAVVLDILLSYMAVILVLPSLSLYIAFMLWRAWRGRRKEGTGKLFYPIVALALVGALSVVMLLDMLSVPHGRPDLSLLSPSSLINVFVATVSAYTNVGITGGISSALALILLLVALLGVYAGIRAGKGRGIFLCASICAMSSLLLTVLATASIISPRYVLFAAPFYMLLLAYGALELLRLPAVLRSARQPETTAASVTPSGQNTPSQEGSWVLAVLLVMLFVVGAFNYINPATHSNLSYKPDFRGVAEFLSATAKPDDLIIVIDDPPLGYNVASFYLRDSPPAPMFDARDPRLYREQPTGSIYWVVNSLDGNITRQLATPDPRWSSTALFEGVLVLSEDAQGEDMASHVESMAVKLSAIHPQYQPVTTLEGMVKQARGDVEGAAQTYNLAGTYFPIGTEYLRAAQLFERHGLKTEAWRQGLVAKFMEPYRSEIHTWFAEQLQAEGYQAESQIETQLAQELMKYNLLR